MEGIYVISGFTPELASKWAKDFRKDLTLYMDKKSGEAYAKISLNIFEAIVMKIAMIKYNISHPCVLKLKRYKGKHFRV